jgi:hypothetical protein
MSINLTVPTELLTRPEVAQAVTALINALAGRETRTATAPAAATTTPRVEAPAPAPAPAPTPASAAPAKPDRSLSYDDFYAGLPARSQAFLDLVRDRGVVRVGEVVEALGLPGPKAVGGITGAIGRWGPARGVTLPYEAITLAGERAWRWIADGKPAPLPSARELGAQALAKDEADPIDALIDALPDVPQRLLELVRSKGQVPVPEVLNTLGLAKAQALSSHLRVIANKATQLGLAVPYERTTSPTGESGFRWLAGRSGGQVLPFKDREPETESDDGGARPDLAGAGVRRRRGSRAG